MITDFSQRLIQWQKQHGRHHLPWQVSDPYCIWLSEIMLQQTQVSTVLNYYPRFIAQFPTVHALAQADIDDVLALWQGLGYYSRARNLHKAAQQIVSEFNGHFPQERQQLETLCGVGRSTAAAIAAFAYQQRETILDGNVKRVLCRVFGYSGSPNDKNFERSLWTLANTLLPTSHQDMPAYTQGLMDLGATICKRSKPLCDQCPMQKGCIAYEENRIEELPQKKTPIKVSVLPIFWLKVHNQNGDLLLEKRPSQGIWGGLFCLPSFETSDALIQFASTLNIDSTTLFNDAELVHKLTHRTMQIHVWSTHQLASESLMLPQNSTWVPIQSLHQYGLPKPLQRLLNEPSSSLFHSTFS